MFQNIWKMLVKIAGLDAIKNRESVTGAAVVVGAVEKIGQEVDVMAVLGDHQTINVYLTQVCLQMFFPVSCYLPKSKWII